MKKIICIAVLCLACALSFYGCSGNKENNNSDRNMVIGKIETVEGNVITLATADTYSMFGNLERPSGERPEGFNPEDFEGEMPEGFNPEDFEGEMPEGFNPEDFGGERPEGFNPEDFEGEMPEGFNPENFSGERPEGSMPQMGGMMNFDASSLTFSGETETFTVPEGMKIGNGDYTSLKVGDVIMISFDDVGGIGEITVIPTTSGEDVTAE